MNDLRVVRLGAEQLVARLEGASEQLQDRLLVVMRRLSIKAQGKVKSQKLTGQVLHVRTGTLRRSINQQVEARPGVISARVGTNVRYAALHEFGFTGAENVRAYVRRSRDQMNMARFRTRKDGTRVEIRGSYAKAGGGAGVVNVRAHVRQMNYPERSYLRSTLDEMVPEIEQDIRKAVIKALKLE